MREHWAERLGEWPCTWAYDGNHGSQRGRRARVRAAGGVRVRACMRGSACVCMWLYVCVVAGARAHISRIECIPAIKRCCSARIRPRERRSTCDVSARGAAARFSLGHTTHPPGAYPRGRVSRGDRTVTVGALADGAAGCGPVHARAAERIAATTFVAAGAGVGKESPGADVGQPWMGVFALRRLLA